MSNTVDHPSHYQHPSGVEAIDICEHLGFNLGNAYKYLARAGKKGPAAEDLRKAAWYLRREAYRTDTDEKHVYEPQRRLLLRVAESVKTGSSLWSFCIEACSGVLTKNDMASLADECEREAAAVESGQ